MVVQAKPRLLGVVTRQDLQRQMEG